MANLPDEKTYVEIPFIERLKGMGWGHIEGNIDVPYLTERESFREVLLKDGLCKALKKINLDEDRLGQIVSALERISAPKLMEANKEAFDLIVGGFSVSGGSNGNSNREKTARIIDFEHPEQNDFLAVNQFRVDVPGGKTFIAPDIVLFVNGIPLVVECKMFPSLKFPLIQLVQNDIYPL